MKPAAKKRKTDEASTTSDGPASVTSSGDISSGDGSASASINKQQPKKMLIESMTDDDKVSKGYFPQECYTSMGYF